MRKITFLLIIIILIALTACSKYEVLIVENELPADNRKKIQLDNSDNMIISNAYAQYLNTSFSKVETETLFDIVEISLPLEENMKIINCIFYGDTVFFTAKNFITDIHYIYKLEGENLTEIYKAPQNQYVLRLFEQNNLMYFVEKCFDGYYLRVFNPFEGSIKTVYKLKYYDFSEFLYCGDYIGLVQKTQSSASYAIEFYNTITGQKTDELVLSILDYLPIESALLKNNCFIYRDRITNTLCYYDIDTKKIKTVTIVMDVTHEYLLFKQIGDKLIMRDGTGINLYDFSKNKDYKLVDIRGENSDVFHLISDVAIYSKGDKKFYAGNYKTLKEAYLFADSKKEIAASNYKDKILLISSKNNAYNMEILTLKPNG